METVNIPYSLTKHHRRVRLLRRGLLLGVCFASILLCAVVMVLHLLDYTPYNRGLMITAMSFFATCWAWEFRKDAPRVALGWAIAGTAITLLAGYITYTLYPVVAAA